jgi:hypothetical protein
MRTCFSGLDPVLTESGWEEGRELSRGTLLWAASALIFRLNGFEDMEFRQLREPYAAHECALVPEDHLQKEGSSLSSSDKCRRVSER